MYLASHQTKLCAIDTGIFLVWMQSAAEGKQPKGRKEHDKLVLV